MKHVDTDPAEDQQAEPRHLPPRKVSRARVLLASPVEQAHRAEQHRASGEVDGELSKVLSVKPQSWPEIE
jgi:hypothetical protein